MYKYYINLNKNSLIDFNLLVDYKVSQINERVEEIEVEGRDGSLTIAKGTYPNRIVTINATLNREHEEDIEDFEIRVQRVVRWLKGNGGELILSNRLNHKLIVKQTNVINVEMTSYNAIDFEIEYVCEPFFYDNDLHKVSITTPTTLTVDTDVVAKPIIEIYGSGTIQLTIGDTTTQINNVDNYVKLDCDLLTCVDSNGASKTIDMIGDFPKLFNGANAIEWVGNIVKVDITPRARYW